MGDIKYQYAYNEAGEIVSIDDLSKETSKLHSYTCIGCGNTLLPRAIGSKYRKPHFYHKELVECSGETYLHKLAKKTFKNKFDSSEKFIISYQPEQYCKNTNCHLKNLNCRKRFLPYDIDLKKYYDTCSEETAIGDFIADLLLTNSKNPSIDPLLIEICVTHPCDEEKRNSGLKIIEISIKDEQNIKDIFSSGKLEETLTPKNRADKIEFISFKREVAVNMFSHIARYVFDTEKCVDGYITYVNCHNCNKRIYKKSQVELNIAQKQVSIIQGIWVPLEWMSKYKHLRRCCLCKFYYATQFENSAFCRLSKKYGTPKYPNMDYAENCRSYNTDRRMPDYKDLDYYIEEVTSSNMPTKDIYRVIIAGSSSFDDYDFFVEKCDYFLTEKLKTHNVVILSGTSYRVEEYINQYSYNNCLTVENFFPKWREERKSIENLQTKMLKNADALIAFWDGKSYYTRSLIQKAKPSGIKVAVVKYNQKVQYK